MNTSRLKQALGRLAAGMRRVSHPIGRSRTLGLGLTAALVVVAGTVAFTVTRIVRDTEPSAKAETSVAQDGRPDTSVPNWGVPFKEQEAARPRYPQTVNGIRLLPRGGDPSMSTCKPGEAQHADEDVADASPLAVHAEALPRGATVDPSLSESVRCAGRVTLVERFFVISPEPGAAEAVASGRSSWFDVEHGGYFWITRMRLTGPAWDGAEVPSEQWSAGTVAGLPAAIGKPLLPGFGHSSVAVWDEQAGILSVVRANDRPIGEVLAVAAGLVK